MADRIFQEHLAHYYPDVNLFVFCFIFLITFHRHKVAYYSDLQFSYVFYVSE